MRGVDSCKHAWACVWDLAYLSDICVSGVQHNGYSVDVAKVSTERGFLVLQVDYCPLYGISGCPLFTGF